MSARPNRQLQRRARALARSDGLSYQAALQRLTAPAGAARGVRLGIPELDRVLSPGGGLPAGRVFLLRGPSRHGKTAWLLDRVVEAARGGRNVLLVNAEEPSAAVTARLAYAAAGVSPRDTADPRADGSAAVERVMRAVQVLDGGATTPLRVAAIDAAIDAARAAGRNVEVVAVDNLLLVADADAVPALVAREFADLAARKRVAVIATLPVSCTAEDAPSAGPVSPWPDVVDYIAHLRRDGDAHWECVLDANRHGARARARARIRHTLNAA